MISKFLNKFFTSYNEKQIKSFSEIINKINSKEKYFSELSDNYLKEQTHLFKEKLNSKKYTLDDILADAFAVCREAAKRTIQMRHFDVQLMGGIALHKGMICEMKTGEGKTLVSTLAAYLNALPEKGVHIVTVNDYLAERDSQWMGEVYKFLGLSVGCIKSNMSDIDRKKAYQCDITHGTNNEFGFDYLRDNLKLNAEEMTTRGFNYAIIDEVDCILIDEARTPLIISGPTETSSKLYQEINKLIPTIKKENYDIDEKTKTIFLNDVGIEECEELLKKQKIININSNLYDMENISIVHHINQALKAHHLFKDNIDYLVQNNQVMIIDEFTGRIMEGRRFSEGLHQALEAKEQVKIQQENQTLASITFQNYFRNYKKLSGMTGTAATESDEFLSTYNLEVVSIPTHKKEIRKDQDDLIYKTSSQKYKSLIQKIEKAHKNHQPILVGTISIENSEALSKMLKKAKIPHNILNAKHHEKEALIISQAGKSNAVTIATNMAGRGTDIMLGGNPANLAKEKNISPKEAEEVAQKDREKVISAGGLLVLGTERHESRRIDNQLRGRSGRQGDPGETEFYISLEDDLMRIFGSDKIKVFLDKLGLQEDEALFHPWITKALQKAQKKVEANNFEIRKSLIKYDDVINEQRKVIFNKRKEIINAKQISGTIDDFKNDIISQLISKHIPPKTYIENWNLNSLDNQLENIFNTNYSIVHLAQNNDIDEQEIKNEINKITNTYFENLMSSHSRDIHYMLQKNILLISLDEEWRYHLNQLDHLKKGINLRAYGQKDPINEFKLEAFAAFEEMLENLKIKTIKRLTHVHISNESIKQFKQNKLLEDTDQSQINKIHPEINNQTQTTNKNPYKNVGRNDKCPCNSGKKFKHCCGAI